MTPGSPVRIYGGQSHHRVVLGGLTRNLPVVQIKDGVYIASDAELILGDVEFITRAAEVLAERVSKFKTEVILSAEAKSIALSYQLASRLGHRRFIVARKGAKRYMGEFLEERLTAITTASEQRLLVTSTDSSHLSGKRVCLLDDVVSTGATFTALEAIVRKAGGVVACRAAIWREGPWTKNMNLVCLGALPLYLRAGVDVRVV